MLNNFCFYRVDQKKCPTLSESSGISLQIQDDFSIKWGIFFGPPCTMYYVPSCNDASGRETHWMQLLVTTSADIDFLVTGAPQAPVAGGRSTDSDTCGWTDTCYRPTSLVGITSYGPHLNTSHITQHNKTHITHHT